MKLDSAQIAVKNKLDNLLDKIEHTNSSNNLLKKIAKLFNFTSFDKIFHGFYIYGGVGRGKTMLMKSFYHKIHHLPKAYFHFHEFMTKIHENLHQIRQQKHHYPDELHEAISRMIFRAPKNYVKIICFDEFQVVDVADAMLLSRIFEYFFKLKIIFIITSNSHPQELYQNGLQRDLFLKFINMILLKNIEVLNLDSNNDYRVINRFENTKKIHRKYFVSNPKNRAIFKQIIHDYTQNINRKKTCLKVWGREITIKKSFDKIAIFNFEELFLENYSSADYRAICKHYEVIFLKKIPQLLAENINEIRRFTLFIDEAYEQKIMIIFLAKNNLKKWHEITNFVPYFARTISRINEIISDNYCAKGIQK